MLHTLNYRKACKLINTKYINSLLRISQVNNYPSVLARKNL